MEKPTLPLKSVVLFIAVGALVFILVFCFVKRQIRRYSLKSSRGTHVFIGTNAPKNLKLEIERRLRRVSDIKYEPGLIDGRDPGQPPLYFDKGTVHYYYRMKALDMLKLLDAEFAKYNPAILRNANSSLRLYLMEQQQSGALQGINAQVVQKFFKLYEHARHDPSEFREAQYEEYKAVLDQLLIHIRNKISKGDNKKTFPFHIGDSVFYCPQATDNIPLINRPSKATQLLFRGSTKSAYGGVESSQDLSAEKGQPC